MSKLAVVLLAAGHGSRMKSKKQKILHDVGGKRMVQHIFEEAERVADLPPVLVIGVGGEGVKRLLGEKATFVLQAEQLGTGHAAMMAQPVLQGRSEQVLVTYGDMPLLTAVTMQKLADQQRETGAVISMLTVLGDPDSSFGRVVRGADCRVLEIVEFANAKQRENAADLLAIRELNVGVYCFDAGWLWANINDLPLRQARSGQEYYLTDMVEIAVKQGRLVTAAITDDPDEGLGAGTRAELVAVEKAFRRRFNAHWLDNGVTLVDPDTIYIDAGVTIGQDTVIWPNTFLQGETAVGADCTIGPNTLIRDARIGDGCVVEQALVENAELPAGRRVSGGRYDHE